MKEGNKAMMDSLVPIQANVRLAEAIHQMTRDLVNEGFDEDDILDFLQVKTRIEFERALVETTLWVRK